MTISQIVALVACIVYSTIVGHLAMNFTIAKFGLTTVALITGLLLALVVATSPFLLVLVFV